MADYEPRLRQLSETRISAARALAVLKAEGHEVSLSTVGRRLGEWRSQPQHPKRAKVSKAQRAVVPPPLLTRDELPDPYVPDDESIDGHMFEIGEWIDRRVDAAVVKELGSAEHLRDRLVNLGTEAGWSTCGECGCPVVPEKKAAARADGR